MLKRKILNKPMWPMNAVSIREAIGSAVKARMVGTEICIISTPSSSFLRAFLEALNNMGPSTFVNSISNKISKAWKTSSKVESKAKKIILS